MGEKTTNGHTKGLCAYASIKLSNKKTNAWLEDICCAQGHKKLKFSIDCYCITRVNATLLFASQLIFRGLWDEKIFIKTTTKLVYQFCCGFATRKSQEMQSFICHNGSSGSHNLKNKIQLPVMGLLGWIITRFCCGSKHNKAFLWCHKNACSRLFYAFPSLLQNIKPKSSQSISFTNLSGMSLTFTCLKNALHFQKTVNTDNRYFFSLECFGWCKIKNCMKSMKIKIPWWNLLRMGLSLFIENHQCFAKEQEFVFYITAVDVRWWPCQAQRLYHWPLCLPTSWTLLSK